MTAFPGSVLSTTDLEIGYDFCLLRNVNLKISPGTLTILRGPNGSGKTTLAKALFGLIPPMSGQIEWDIEAVGQPSPSKLFRSGYRMLGQGPRGFSRMTGLQQAHLLQKLHGIPTESANHQNRKLVGDMSLGQRRMAALELILTGNPRCVILDEPLAGLDKNTAERTKELVLSKLANGVSIVMIEHRWEGWLKYANSVFEIQGKVLKSSIPVHIEGPKN